MEKTIVTSTGPYVITWNFRRVKAGHTFDYTIKKYPSRVVADNFRYGSDKNVIVALPDDVTMVNKKQFMSPQKAFAPMTPKTKARIHIRAYSVEPAVARQCGQFALLGTY